MKITKLRKSDYNMKYNDKVIDCINELIDITKRQSERIKELENKIAAIEAISFGIKD